MAWIKHVMVDKWRSLIASIIITILVMSTSENSLLGNGKSDIITVIITIVTITVGFATAALTMFLGMSDKPVIERIKRRNYVETLVNSFKDLIYFGGIVILLSIIISIYNLTSLTYMINGVQINFNELLIALFVFCTCASLMYALDLVKLIILIFRQILIEPNKEHSQ